MKKFKFIFKFGLAAFLAFVAAFLCFMWPYWFYFKADLPNGYGLQQKGIGKSVLIDSSGRQIVDGNVEDVAVDFPYVIGWIGPNPEKYRFFLLNTSTGKISKFRFEADLHSSLTSKSIDPLWMGKSVTIWSIKSGLKNLKW